MPALNFTVFVDKVESGEKRQTIRKPRKVPIRVGDKLHLYTGMRTKDCRKLGESVCERTMPVTIHADRVKVGCLEYSPATAGLPEFLARADGFDSYADMAAWFDKTHGLPFSGVVIQWGAVNYDA